MTTPLVSITSAFYNEAPDLLDMVRSVFAQTYTNWELILLDDGSTDNSLEIARSINDSRVRVFSNEKNLGRSASLNKITKLARGKYIARMDADDICSTNRIEKQIKLMESNPEIDVCGTGMCYLDRNDIPQGHRYAQVHHDQICSQPDRTFGIAHGTLLGKKTWFEQNPYNESLTLAIDFNLFFKCYRQSTFNNVAEPLYFYKLDEAFLLRPQWVARKASARFLFNHYKETGDWWRAFTNMIVQYSKFVTTVLIFSVGLRKKLMARRYENLSDKEMDFYLREIKTIKDTYFSISNKDIEE